jgi:Lysylphosphatidylglycerol synthase TM region
MDAVPAARRRRVPIGGLTAALFGAGLFAYTLQQTSVQPIIEGLRSVGWGFILILALSGLRTLARAAAWTLCTPGPHGLRIRDTFPAFLTGEALGNLTPLGLFVSEPTKAVFVRHRVTLMTAVSGLATENVLYTLSVAVVITTGTVALLFSFDVPRAVRMASVIVMGGMLVVLAVAAWILARQVRIVTGLLDRLHRRRLAPGMLIQRLEKLRVLEDRIYTFHLRHPERLLPVLALETAYHVAGVAEVFVTLMWISHAPTLLIAFVLETANRATNVVFKFVPLRLGVDEAGTELLTTVLGYPIATGATLAIVRKVRVLFWTGVGIILLAQRGLRPSETAAAIEAAEREQPVL